MLFLQWLLSTPKRNQTGQKKWSFLSCFPTLVLHDHHLRSFCSRVFRFGQSMLRFQKILVVQSSPNLSPNECQGQWKMKGCGKLPLMKATGSDHIVVYMYIYIHIYKYIFIQFIPCCLPDLNVGPTPLERNWSLGFRNVPTAWTRQPARLTHRNLKIVKVKVATWWRLVLSFDNIIEDCLEVPKNTVKIL